MYKSTVAEMTNGIILAQYERIMRVRDNYQTEEELEKELIANLISQGYERFYATNSNDLYVNLKKQIEKLNDVVFSDSEWERFLLEYIDAPRDTMIEKTKKIQENHIYDFTFDDGVLKNIKIIDKKNIHNNVLQVTNQITQKGKHLNRYDVTILVNGLPLIQIELKKRGVSIREAFNQIHKYSKETFNEEHSLFKYIQIFVISNGTYTRYFANNFSKAETNYEFTCEWADAKNNVINDLEDFTATFFEKRVILEILTKYCIFNVENTLLVMRPYQIAATERILWKIESSYQSKRAGTVGAGGFIWHTTGTGKTLTSFKTAKLATELSYIDKVFFVVDRKDLDDQTIKEYKKYQEDSVNSTANTKELKKNIEKKDNRIVVTTIQKLNEFVKKNPNHEIYDKHCVLIYDECHRSQFGEAQKNIRRLFKKYYQFGFTGTPIFPENALSLATTTDVFGTQLHSYVITDAIRDGKVLKFKIDYINTDGKYKSDEIKQEIKAEKSVLLHKDRIEKISKHILSVFNVKTHRNEYDSIELQRENGFNAMFAVQSVKAAKLYYEALNKEQEKLPPHKRIRIAMIYSFSQNEEQAAIGDIYDESFNVSALDSSSKEFLVKAIEDYNKMFKTNYSIDGDNFQAYYSNLSEKVKNREVDLLIVVGMFLTGFDSKPLNTLFVDKNLCYHGLIQAFSRTNRILNKVKSFGNIVCFRELEKNTKDAIKLFGDENSINIILEKSYKEYLNGYSNENGEFKKGYVAVCNEMLEKFPDPTRIEKEADKKEFIKLFNNILKLENVLKNYDEFYEFEKIITDIQMQDMKSTYLKFRDEKTLKVNEPIIDMTDIEFEIELLKTTEINLDYILALIFEKSREYDNKEILKEDIRRIITSSLGTRAKEELIIDFIKQTDLTKLKKTEDVLEAFYTFAKKVKDEEISKIIESERLRNNPEKFINKSIEKGYTDMNGEELSNIMPPTSNFFGNKVEKKFKLFEKIQKIVEIFKGI